MKVGIIGGGLAGMASAIVLAAKGCDVSIFEKNAQLGGKAGVLISHGFRFDTGPSLLTLPSVFDRLFKITGANHQDYFKFLPLDPITSYWFSDGSSFKSRPVPYLYNEIETSFGIPKTISKKYFSYSKKIYDLTHKVFLESSLQNFWTFLQPAAWRAYFQLSKIDVFRTMHEANNSFFTDRRIIQFLDRYATYNGSNPYKAPATLNNIPWVEHGIGAFAVEGGIYSIVQGIGKRMQELGIKIFLNTKIKTIRLTRHNRIDGLIDEKGNQYRFDCLISNVDVSTLYHDILRDLSNPEYQRYVDLPSSNSGVVFFWGMNKQFPNLGLHNVFFSKDYEEEFDDIHNKKQIPIDPTIYINISSKITQEDAPKNNENWFVLVNSPPHNDQDWQKILPVLRSNVLKKLSNHLKQDIEKNIIYESVLTPEQIMNETGSWKGSLYGISSNTKTAAFLRHGNKSKKYMGLYLAGGSVHPGGGMPLVTLSGILAAESVLQNGVKK